MDGTDACMIKNIYNTLFLSECHKIISKRKEIVTGRPGKQWNSGYRPRERFFVVSGGIDAHSLIGRDPLTHKARRGCIPSGPCVISCHALHAVFLQIAVHVVDLVDGHAIGDGFAFGVLEIEDFLGPDEDFVHEILGNDLETVIVTEDEIAGADDDIVG